MLSDFPLSRTDYTHYLVANCHYR